MLTFVARRILLAILVIAGVIVVTFVVAHIVLRDPAATWAGPHATAAQVTQARTFLGLEPLPVQLVSYLSGIAAGNLALPSTLTGPCCPISPRPRRRHLSWSSPRYCSRSPWGFCSAWCQPAGRAAPPTRSSGPARSSAPMPVFWMARNMLGLGSRIQLSRWIADTTR